jgi:hypothetical protein
MEEGASRTIFEAGEIASRLMQNQEFFEGVVVQVLTQVAKAGKFTTPTKTEVAEIKQRLRCQVRILCTSVHDAYMHCIADNSEIIVNELVKYHNRDVVLNLDMQKCSNLK